MMNDTVVVIRTNKGEDLLAIFCREINGVVKLKHPYYVRINPTTVDLSMIPYCPLSEEIYFEMKRSNLEFVVTANQVVSKNFLKMTNAVDQMLASKYDPEDEEEEDFDVGLSEEQHISQTKH